MSGMSLESAAKRPRGGQAGRHFGTEGRSGTRKRRPGREARLAGLVLAVAAAAGLAGCGGQGGGPAAGAGDVVVAAVPATGAAGLYIAQERGLFAKAGLHVTIESSVSAADVLPDLVRGSVQVSLGQWTSAVDAQAHGVRLHVVAAGNDGAPSLEELVTGPGSGIRRLSQLRGKLIAVNALAGLSQLLTDTVLAAAGISPGQVRWTVIPFPDMATALAAHRIDAAFMIQPYLVAARPGTITELADPDSGATRGFPVTGYVTSAAWAQHDPGTLAAFTRALRAGQQIAASDPAAVTQAVARYAGITIPHGMPLGGFPASVSVGDLERTAALMQQYRMLPAAADPAALAEAMTR
jgi:NitT/TauT family transport system substrate-binding protein